ncbi:MAG TPA: hypothetical protein VMT63_12130 [Bacteroidales bacterium]|nr:hypothetical protein [Bacteroidales bacterium]
MPAGAAQSGMAYACVMKNDFWSSFHNQAALAGNRGMIFGTSYEERFGMSELGTCTAALIVPASHSAIGAIYSRFGYHDFSRQMAGLSCGLRISPALSAGIQADFFSEKTYGEYSSFNTVTFEVGLIAKFSSSLTGGIHLFNPLPSSFRKHGIASVIRSGLGLDAGNGLFTGCEFELTTGGSFDFRTGMEYELSKSFRLRGGFMTRHSSFCLGFGYKARPATIDFSISTHDRLGITSSVSLTFRLGN